MNYKLFATDMDDTLLLEDNSLGDYSLAVLKRLVATGIKVVLASGRMYKAIKRHANDINVNAPIIACNGAEIYDPTTNELLSTTYMDADICKEIALDAEGRGAHLQVYHNDEYYFANKNQYSDLYESIINISGIELGYPISKMALNAYPKMLIIAKPEEIILHREYFLNKYAGRINATISKPFYLEITHPKANKGAALEKVAAMLKIDPDQIIACGDALNDISMIKYAGLGVAVGNARQETKDAADLVVESHQNQGVAKLLETLLDEGKFKT